MAGILSTGRLFLGWGFGWYLRTCSSSSSFTCFESFDQLNYKVPDETLLLVPFPFLRQSHRFDTCFDTTVVGNTGEIVDSPDHRVNGESCFTAGSQLDPTCP